MIYWKVKSLSSLVIGVGDRAIVSQFSISNFGLKSEIIDSFEQSEIKLSGSDVIIYVDPLTIKSFLSINETAFLTRHVFCDFSNNVVEESGVVAHNEFSVILIKEISKKCAGVIVTDEQMQGVIVSSTGSGKSIFRIPQIISAKSIYANNRKGLVVSALNLTQQVYSFFLRICSLHKLAGKFNRYVLYFSQRKDTKYQFLFIKRKLRVYRIRFLISMRAMSIWVVDSRYYRKNIINKIKYFRCRIDCNVGYLIKNLCVVQYSKAISPARLEIVSANCSDIEYCSGEEKHHQELINDKNPIYMGSYVIKNILWFGFHTPNGQFVNMEDILILSSQLELLAEKYNVELVIVSNDIKKYCCFIKPLRIATRYYRWVEKDLSNHLSKSDVVILPGGNIKKFGVYESDKRALLALHYGVPVVATTTTTLKEFSECIVFDDWTRGIEKYFFDRKGTSEDIVSATRVMEENYSLRVIEANWRQLFSQTRDQSLNSLPHKIVVFVVQLATDFELVRPFLLGPHKFVCELIIYDKLIYENPNILKSICEYNVEYWIFSENFVRQNNTVISSRYAASVCATETNLAPHKFSRLITIAMNNAAKLTYTMQHGHDNVGLTYDDDIDAIENINFLSKKIFTWGDTNLLHTGVSKYTREKCIPIGLISKLACDRQLEDIHFPRQDNYNLIIGLYENLHWHRYSGYYIEKYLSSVEYLSTKFDDILFVVKPHPLGNIDANMYKYGLENPKNLFIIEKGSPLFRLPTINLIKKFSGIISTPSTILVDAAVNNVPVALFEFDLINHRYEYLYKINIMSDLSRYIYLLRNEGLKESSIRENSKKFITKYIKSMDAKNEISRIISDDLNRCIH